MLHMDYDSDDQRLLGGYAQAAGCQLLYRTCYLWIISGAYEQNYSFLSRVYYNLLIFIIKKILGQL